MFCYQCGSSRLVKLFGNCSHRCEDCGAGINCYESTFPCRKVDEATKPICDADIANKLYQEHYGKSKERSCVVTGPEAEKFLFELLEKEEPRRKILSWEKGVFFSDGEIIGIVLNNTDAVLIEKTAQGIEFKKTKKTNIPINAVQRPELEDSILSKLIRTIF